MFQKRLVKRDIIVSLIGRASCPLTVCVCVHPCVFDAFVCVCVCVCVCFCVCFVCVSKMTHVSRGKYPFKAMLCKHFPFHSAIQLIDRHTLPLSFIVYYTASSENCVHTNPISLPLFLPSHPQKANTHLTQFHKKKSKRGAVVFLHMI